LTEVELEGAVLPPPELCRHSHHRHLQGNASESRRKPRTAEPTWFFRHNNSAHCSHRHSGTPLRTYPPPRRPGRGYECVPGQALNKAAQRLTRGLPGAQHSDRSIAVRSHENRVGDWQDGWISTKTMSNRPRARARTFSISPEPRSSERAGNAGRGHDEQFFSTGCGLTASSKEMSPAEDRQPSSRGTRTACAARTARSLSRSVRAGLFTANASPRL